MYNILIAIALTPSITLFVGLFVGGLEALIAWIDEKEEEHRIKKQQKKLRKEQKNIRKEREKLWDMYLRLSLE